MRDYYTILELPPSASQEMIREQYRFLIQAWHPDKFSNPKQKEKAEERTKLINEAYSVLNNPNKRAQYDSVRSTQSSSFRQEQRQQQAEEAKSRTGYEQHQRKKADEERQRKQAEEAKSRTGHEQQQRKKADEERQRKQANTIRTANLIVIGILLLGISLAVGFFSNQHPSSETQQVTSDSITPKPTPSLTFVSTQVSPTITLSPTPDKRLILVEPKELLLEKADLPLGAKYILPGPEWITPNHNSEIISAWGVEEGSKYVEETGRVDGWEVTYLRSDEGVSTPEQIKDIITMYKTPEGARLALNTFYKSRNLNLGFSEIDYPIGIGDLAYILVYKEKQSNGRYSVELIIFFSYRNYIHAVGGLGYEDEVTIGYIEYIAKQLLRKLQTAPLSNP